MIAVKNRRLSTVGFVLALMTAVLVAAPAPVAAAQTFTVTRTDDPTPGACVVGDCSLREAVIAANGDAMQDTIVVPQLGGDYTLTISVGLSDDDVAAIGDLDITNPVAIQGSQVVVRAGGGLNGRLFHVLTGATATVSDIILVDGRPRGSGGGIFNAGTLTLDGVRVINNIAGSSFLGTAGGHGGAIYNSGTLTMTDTELSNNKAGNGGTPFFCFSSCNGGDGGNGGHGGNLYNAAAGVVVATASEIRGGDVGNGGAGDNAEGPGSFFGGDGGDGGDGGGVFNSGGTVTLTDTVVLNNAAEGVGGAPGTGVGLGSSGVAGSASVGGGGIFNDGGTMTINGGSTVGNSNTARNGGGIYNDGGTVTIADSTVGPNTATSSGGGIYNLNGAIFASASTVSGNDSTFLGGGIYSHGASSTVGLSNVTISGNSAGAGGGLYNTVSSSVTSTNATFSDNTAANNGGGFRNFANLTLEATIVAGNMASIGPDCETAATSAGYNLIGNTTDCAAFVPGATDQVNIDPKLGPLQDNGSPDTHALLDGSPALDVIPPVSCAVATDARNVARPQNTGCDIGAFELAVGTNVGLVDTSQGMWHLRNSDGVVTSFFYGNPVDLPVSGDWDFDGDSTPGMYRQSDGFFYARNSNTQGPADDECFAGDPEDVPLSGDWDGDGDDNLGIYRPSQQMFYLFTITCTGSPMGAAQISFLFGNPGDKPVAGDWDGDGIDEVGLHRESTGFFYWRNTLDTGVASDEIFFGDPNDRFVSGDWGIIDQIDTPAIFRPSDLTFYFRHTLTQGVADSQFIWAGAGSGWLPVSGLFGLD